MHSSAPWRAHASATAGRSGTIRPLPNKTDEIIAADVRSSTWAATRSARESTGSTSTFTTSRPSSASRSSCRRIE